jgi:hypothetical protein
MPKTYLFLFATLLLFACTKSKDGQLFEKVEKSCFQSTMNKRVGMDVEDRWGSAWSATW